MCRADPEALSAINVCEAWQVAALEKVVRQYDSGAMTEFSPCQLWPYLRNRTLWVVGCVDVCAACVGRMLYCNSST